MNMNYRRN